MFYIALILEREGQLTCPSFFGGITVVIKGSKSICLMTGQAWCHSYKKHKESILEDVQINTGL